jgi:hypothetical protein
MRFPSRPSRLKAISIPSALRNAWDLRSRPASACGFLGQSAILPTADDVMAEVLADRDRKRDALDHRPASLRQHRQHCLHDCVLFSRPKDGLIASRPINCA